MYHGPPDRSFQAHRNWALVVHFTAYSDDAETRVELNHAVDPAGATPWRLERCRHLSEPQSVDSIREAPSVDLVVISTLGYLSPNHLEDQHAARPAAQLNECPLLRIIVTRSLRHPGERTPVGTTRLASQVDPEEDPQWHIARDSAA